jgi:hypothetical protein
LAFAFVTNTLEGGGLFRMRGGPLEAAAAGVVPGWPAGEVALMVSWVGEGEVCREFGGGKEVVVAVRLSLELKRGTRNLEVEAEPLRQRLQSAGASARASKRRNQRRNQRLPLPLPLPAVARDHPAQPAQPAQPCATSSIAMEPPIIEPSPSSDLPLQVPASTKSTISPWA